MIVVDDDETDIDDPVGEEAKLHKTFSITSYGADYPVELIPFRITSGDWYAPTFQRNFVWSKNQASRFIESLLLGLPVPGIFLFKELATGKHLIIDGQQRTKSLQLFLEGGEFNDKIFRLSDVAPEFEGKTFSELDDADQRRLKESIIHATIFQQESPSGDISSVYEVFERINTGGSKLSAQEIRSCINHGRFVEFLEELASEDVWQDIFRSKSKRLKDHELILRFFAFYFKLDLYSSPMKRFLDDYMGSVSKIEDADQTEYKKIFLRTLSFIRENVSEKLFRPERAFNAAVFDCVAVATAKLLSENVELKNFAENYHRLLSDDMFLELTSRSTADEERVQARFAKAIATLRQ